MRSWVSIVLCMKMWQLWSKATAMLRSLWPQKQLQSVQHWLLKECNNLDQSRGLQCLKNNDDTEAQRRLSENAYVCKRVLVCVCLHVVYSCSETAQNAWRDQLPESLTSTLAQMSVDPEIYLTCSLGKAT